MDSERLNLDRKLVYENGMRIIENVQTTIYRSFEIS